MNDRRVALISVTGLVLLLVAMIWFLATSGGRTIYESDSEFGRVRVTESRDGLRALYTGEGRGRQTALYPDRPLHLESAYTRVGMVGLALVPQDARMLFVGLGGGAMPTYTRHLLPQATIDVVEIDPIIVDVAQQYFNFRPDERMRVHTGDGRAFIEAAPPGTYDLIVLDAFSDDEIPRALATREFLEAVRAALTESGVVVSNLWTANDDYESMVATYDVVFERVHLLRVPQRRQDILVTGPGVAEAERESLVAAVESLESRADLGFDLRRLVENGYRRESFDAPVLVDETGTDS